MNQIRYLLKREDELDDPVEVKAKFTRADGADAGESAIAATRTTRAEWVS